MAEVQRKQSADLMKTRADLNETLFRADTMAKQTSIASQREAVGMYKKVLTDARDAGKVSNETYEAMTNVMGNISDMREKTMFAQRLAKAASLAVLGYAGYRGVDMVIKTGH